MRRNQLGALLLAGVMTVLSLSGCGAMPSTGNQVKESVETGSSESTPDATGDKAEASGNTADSDEKITLRIVDWSDGSAQQREAFHKKYMEEHPNITIEYTMLTVDQFKNTIVTMIKSGDGPDIFPIPGGMTLKTAVEEGWYQPINSFVTEDFASQFDPRSFEDGVTHIGDDWYTITEQMPVIQCLFFYNKDVLEQAGMTEIPTTYSEFREACKKITENGNGSVYGLIDGGKQVNRMDVLARSLAAAAGGKVAAITKVLTVDGRAPYDTDEMKQAMGFLKGLADDGSIHPDTVNISAPEAREMFAQGQAGFLCQGMWCVAHGEKGIPI